MDVDLLAGHCIGWRHPYYGGKSRCSRAHWCTNIPLFEAPFDDLTHSLGGDDYTFDDECTASEVVWPSFVVDLLGASRLNADQWNGN